jgi:hypothetical protein
LSFSLYANFGSYARALWSGMAVLACLGTPAIAADCPTSASDITTDRPDVTNSSIVVPTGSLQSENGVNLMRRNGAPIVDGTNSRLRLGVAPCLEVFVDLPNYFAAVRGPASSGFSDVAPAINGRSVRYPANSTFRLLPALGCPPARTVSPGRVCSPICSFPGRAISATAGA